MTETIIGERLFTDGIVRQVFLDDQGRQFVWDEGERIYGIWLFPEMVEPDLAMVVQA